MARHGFPRAVGAALLCAGLELAACPGGGNKGGGSTTAGQGGHADGGASAGHAGATAGSGAAGAAGLGGGALAGAGGAAAGDAGAGGGRNAGAGGGAPTGQDAAADPCAGALICDDFESYTAGAAPGGGWKTSLSDGTLKIDTTKSYSGTHAVRVQIATGGSTYKRAYMSQSGKPLFPLPTNVMYGRMMIWNTANPGSNVHWTNIQGEGPVAGKTFRSYYRYGGQYDTLMGNYETMGVASDCWKHSTTAMPTGQWACFEWRYNGPNNEMNFWLNGNAVNDLTAVQKGEGCISHDTQDNWYAPTFDILYLGWEHYQSTPVSIDAWIDDVAVGTSRIGCPPVPKN